MSLDRPFALLLPLLLLAGCVAPDPGASGDAGAAPGPVEARLGETARLGNLGVRPIAVLEDSRCPRDVTCVWAGRLRLRAAISGAGEAELTLGEPYALPGGGALTLVTALPEPLTRPPPGAERGPARRFGFRLD